MMQQYLVSTISGQSVCINLPGGEDVHCAQLMLALQATTGVPLCHQRLLINGKDVSPADPLPLDSRVGWHTAQLLLRLRGGKGGFGSLLRNQGARAAVKETTNFEACRDLNGRRLRNVHDEEKLAEWIANEEKRKQEKEERKRRKQEDILRGPLHKFDHHKLGAEAREITREVEDAVSSALSKRKSPSPPSDSTPPKKLKMWEDDLEDESNESDSDSETGDKGKRPAVAVVGEQSDSDGSAPDSEASTSSSQATASTPTQTSTNDAAGSSTAQTTGASTSNPGGKSTGTNSSAAENQVVKDSGSSGEMDVDLNSFESAADLESVGFDRLKHALMKRGLKCGGNLQQRAQRLFSVKGLNPDQYPAAIRAK